MATREGLGAVGYQIVFALLDELEKVHPGISKTVIQSIIDNNKQVLRSGPNPNAEEAIEILQPHLDRAK